MAFLSVRSRPQEAWLQEYCCEAIDEASAFLTLEMIMACERLEVALIQSLDKVKGDLYIGYDVARRKYLSVIYVAELLGEALVTWHI